MANTFFGWPTPQECVSGTGRFVLSAPLSLVTHGDAPWLLEASRKAADVLNHATNGTRPAVVEGEGGGATWRVTTMEALTPGLKPVLEDEGYALDVTRSRVWLAGRDARGVFYGAQTLAQLLDRGEELSLPLVTVRDWPRYPIRGVHCYLPAREQMDFFWRFLDFLAEYKCNTLVLELGGGMEYKKHPEINETWVYITKWRQGPYNLACYWKQDEKEPWYIATDQPASGRTLLEYGKRFQTEAMFSDFKKRGFQLENSRIKIPERVDRLLLVIVLAYLFLSQLGLRCIRSGQRRFFENSKRRFYSLLQLGMASFFEQLNGDKVPNDALPRFDSRPKLLFS